MESDRALSAKEARKRSQYIDKMLKRDAKKERNLVRLLMLGAGGTGKSTFVKQMKIMNLMGFSKDDRSNYRSVMQQNIVDAIVALIGAMDQLGLSYESREAEDAASRLLDAFDEERLSDESSVVLVDRSNVRCRELSADEAEDVHVVWSDHGIRTAFKNRSKFQFEDMSAFFLESCRDIVKPSYEVSDVDILRARVRTTAVTEIQWKMNKSTVISVTDVGGQRGQRRKWLPCFRDVNAIIFTVALSEYDTLCSEDGKTNRMHESLKLFHEIVNSELIDDSVVFMLFFNKNDIFEKKIKKVDLNVCFPKYTGGCNYANATEYITRKFESANKRGRKMYSQFTVATDTKNISTIWGIVQEQLFAEIFEQLAF